MKDSTIPPNGDEKDNDVPKASASQNEPIRQDLGDVTVVFFTGETPAPEWTMKPQEQEGDYWFSGKLYVTRGVAEALTELDLMVILTQLRQAVQTQQGLDYLAVFECTDKRVVWVIDTLSRAALNGDDYTEAQKEEHHYYTVLLPSEY